MQLARISKLTAALLVIGILSLATSSITLAGEVSKKDDAAKKPAVKKTAGEWKQLFDGKTHNGWRGYKKDKAPDSWKIVDGALHLKGKGGDIMTKDKFDFFELSLEFNTPKGGNSGVMYRVAEINGPAYFTGPEIQVIGTMNPKDKHSTGSCYALYPPTKNVLKKHGEWNTMRVIIKPGNHVEHWVNGEKVCEYTIGSDDWNKRVAASKFAKWKQFGTIAKGHIVLQDHGNEVIYRNIKIRELK